MNKKIEEYKKKSNRIIKTIELIGFFVIILAILISIVHYNLNKGKEKNQKSSIDAQCILNIDNDFVIYEKNFNLSLKINNYQSENIYKIVIKLNDNIVFENQVSNKDNNFDLDFGYEGKKIINVIILENDEEQYNKTFIGYYVEPYQKQFLDDLSNKSVQVHFIDGTWEKDYMTSLKAIKNGGFKNIKSSFLWTSIEKKENNYDFSFYDQWINEAYNNQLNVYACVNRVRKWGGDDNILNNAKEIEHFTRFFTSLAQKYPNIIGFDILNEPNVRTSQDSGYITDEELKNYSDLIIKIQNSNRDIKIIPAGLANYSNDDNNIISTVNFFEKMNQNGAIKYINKLSFHVYDYYNNSKQDMLLSKVLKRQKQQFNSFGGFIKTFVTEYGVSSYDNNKITEEIQADKLVQQTILMDKSGVDYSNIYNFWNTGDDSTNIQNNYGLVRNNYTPKLSYYSMKTYLSNTNGSEYIGYISGNEGLEAHIYDKDGKPLIIAWSDNKDKTFNFPLGTMTAKDVYGNTITPDSNGTVQITTSPIYIYNITTSCYYQAISNVILTKYNTFLSDYSNEITKIPNLKTEIESLKNKISNISNITTLNESEAIDLMKKHYDLGNKILNERSNGTIQIEYIKISSMLDYLDDIGDTYEDLVTVSAKNRNTNLTETKNLIDEVNQIINNNLDIEIIYPTKILEFSKDFYDKSSYINSVQEENDIKTGLIVSKNLHANLLANWAKSFAEIYVNQVINQYITEHPVNITYSNTNLTNQDVKATIQTTGDIKILNNSGGKEYTFKENGTFTFEYQIKGRTMAITATVSNIDKTAPLITGIQNDKLYIDSVTPKITDVNLENVQLYKNTALIPTYRANSTISEEGNYKLIATDKAGNKTEITFYISRIPASIKYSSTDMTNKNVTATIVSNFSLKVTNNSNSNTYIFKQNGEFTFKYTINGTDLELKATVNNIDKKAPIISGVNPNKIYTSSVIPTVSDENLDKVELYKEEDKVYDYILGNEVKEEGLYKIIATDKAGNTTTTKFGLIERTDTSYKIKNNMILNIGDNTNKSEFSKKIKIGAEYQVLRNGNPISNSDIVATGDILKTTNGNEYTLIVAGDINKDGQLNIKDLVKLRKHLLQIRTLTGIELEAADCNVDGEKINLKDLARMRLLILLKDII